MRHTTHAGIALNALRAWISIARCKPKASPSGKRPTSSMCPAVPSKRGKRTKQVSMRVPLWWPFFKASQVLLSYIASSSGYTWWVPKSAPVAFAWCVYSCNSQALIALSRLPMGRSTKSTGKWRRPSWRIGTRKARV